MAEANALAERISEYLLQCSICFEQFQDPKVLPCQHGFCTGCLEDWTNSRPEKDTIVCPTCRKEAALPEEGVKGLPGHFLANSLQDLCGEEKMVEKSQMSCGNCDDSTKNTAIYYCYDCKEHLCLECQALHEALKVNKTHKLVSIEDKVADENYYCRDHKQIIVEFYCETDDRPVCSHCVSLSTCPADHKRLSLKEAGKKLFTDIVELLSECDRFKQEHETAVTKTEEVFADLMESKQSATATLSKTRDEYIKKLDDAFKNDEDEIEKDCLIRVNEITATEEYLQQNLTAIKEIYQKGLQAVRSDSEYEITATYSTLLKTLEMLRMVPPKPVDPALAYLNYVPPPSPIYNISNMLVKRQWEPAGRFSTKPHLKDICGIVINRDGEVAVTSIRHGVRIFQRTGKSKCSFRDVPGTSLDIAVTPDNRYIIDGKNSIFFYDNNGNQLSKITTTDFNRKASNPVGITVDKDGRIVLGLEDKSLSFHYSDGSVITKVGIKSVPWRLAITSTGDLVVACYDGTLKLMDFNGGLIKDIQPPPGVTRWNPGYVCCCRKNAEIFVGNVGVPKAVYSFTSDGKFVGLVTDDVSMPQGIAISEDGRELMVAELNENRIKIFKRQ